MLGPSLSLSLSLSLSQPFGGGAATLNIQQDSVKIDAQPFGNCNHQSGRGCPPQEHGAWPSARGADTPYEQHGAWRSDRGADTPTRSRPLEGGLVVTDWPFFS